MIIPHPIRYDTTTSNQLYRNGKSLRTHILISFTLSPFPSKEGWSPHLHDNNVLLWMQCNLAVTAWDDNTFLQPLCQ
jgi:hypothetical protein